MCADRPEPIARAAFLFVMYKAECYKPSNTGRLIADVAPENFAFTWQRNTLPSDIASLLHNNRYEPMVVFPHEYAQDERCISEVPSNTGKIPLFIMLDGTWREARKMFRKSAYLHKFPVISITPNATSGYLLRESSHDYQLCTAEVGIEMLKLASDSQAAAALGDYFAVFRRNYLKGKPHLQRKNALADHPFT